MIKQSAIPDLNLQVNIKIEALNYKMKSLIDLQAEYD